MYILSEGAFRGSTQIVVRRPAVSMPPESLVEMQTLRSIPGLLNQSLQFIEFPGDLHAH